MSLFLDFSLVSYDANNRFLRLLVVNYSKACFQLDLAFLFCSGDVKSVIFHYIEFSISCCESVQFIKNLCLRKLLPFAFVYTWTSNSVKFSFQTTILIAICYPAQACRNQSHSSFFISFTRKHLKWQRMIALHEFHLCYREFLPSISI